jgi:hypothetical protein
MALLHDITIVFTLADADADQSNAHAAHARFEGNNLTFRSRMGTHGQFQ